MFNLFGSGSDGKAKKKDKGEGDEIDQLGQALTTMQETLDRVNAINDRMEAEDKANGWGRYRKADSE